MMYSAISGCFSDMSRQILENNLVGVYLHGSAAMGCFHPKLSDLDLIVVVDDSISDQKKLNFMQEVVRLNEKAPAKGIEMSIVRRKFCNPFVYPTPFELHFSVTHLDWFRSKPQDYVEKMKGTDTDLAAHFTILKKYGIVLFGEAIDTVFGEVPPGAYTDSICSDIENAPVEILENPLYITLNLCRVLAWMREGLILSKREGGEWGIGAVPQEFHAVILEALHAYEAGEEMKMEPEAGKRFATYMIKEIFCV